MSDPPPARDTASPTSGPRRLAVIRALNRRGIRLLHVADLVLIYLTLFVITAVMIGLRPEFNALASGLPSGQGTTSTGHRTFR